MPLAKDSNLYAAFERICPHIRGKRNLSAKDVATAIVLSVLNDARDEISKAGKDYSGLDWLIDEAAQQPLRAELRNTIQPCVTAAKNYHLSALVPCGLMDKPVTVSGDDAEFA